MASVPALAQDVGVAAACRALQVPRATWYRRRKPKPSPAPRPTPPRALSAQERIAVLDQLNSDRFVDVAPAAVHNILLDEGIYLCSPRTVYRVLADSKEVRERRNQLRHPVYTKPELLATAPNQVWSWDITKLKGPAMWTYYYLYVLLDIFSRYVVGWMLATSETAAHAEQLIAEACLREGVDRNQLTIHSDRGAPMTSKTVAQLFAELGVTGSFSRPHVSNDNPFSESQFKTLKYRPTFPARFGPFQHALAYCREFFPWYNTQHRHSGIAWLTPADVHFGGAAEILATRQRVLSAAYAAHPERFVRKPPTPGQLPQAVWINPPTTQPTRQDVPGTTLTSVFDPNHQPDSDVTRRIESPVIVVANGTRGAAVPMEAPVLQ